MIVASILYQLSHRLSGRQGSLNRELTCESVQPATVSEKGIWFPHDHMKGMKKLKRRKMWKIIWFDGQKLTLTTYYKWTLCNISIWAFCFTPRMLTTPLLIGVVALWVIAWEYWVKLDCGFSKFKTQGLLAFFILALMVVPYNLFLYIPI